MADDKVKKLAERSMWDKFKDSFQPVAARADENIAENRRRINKLAEQKPAIYLEKNKAKAYGTKGLVDED